MTEQDGMPDTFEPQPGDASGWAFDGEGRLVDTSQPVEVITYGPPPAVHWVQPIDIGAVFGLRCALVGRDRTTYDLRCASEVYESNGGAYLNLVTEAQWYRWRDLDEPDRPDRIPRATCVAARHVWIELADNQETPPQ
jgi:hypothetical protein